MHPASRVVVVFENRVVVVFENPVPPSRFQALLLIEESCLQFSFSFAIGHQLAVTVDGALLIIRSEMRLFKIQIMDGEVWLFYVADGCNNMQITLDDSENILVAGVS